MDNVDHFVFLAIGLMILSFVMTYLRTVIHFAKIAGISKK